MLDELEEESDELLDELELSEELDELEDEDEEPRASFL